MNIIIRLFQLAVFRYAWRKKNRHNMTIPQRIFSKNTVKIGRYTYGSLNVFSYGSKDEKLIIGDFVSIASGVKFILGGNHRHDTFSTYPFKTKLFCESNESTTKGAIIIGDDVWIGTDCIILSGVKIGQGAVIGAGSVVSRNIPPYAIVVGNPASVIKYRFDEKLIQKMKGYEYANLDVKVIKDKLKLFYEPLDSDTFQRIID